MSLSSVVLGGCFDAPPEYSVPERLPPILDLVAAAPNANAVTTVQPTSRVEFSVPYQVENPGEGLRAVFLLDRTSTSAGLVQRDARLVNGSSTATFPWVWTADGAAPAGGCHTMTLIMSYESNFLVDYDPIDSELVAQATWFFDLKRSNDVDCWPKGAGSGN